MRNIEQMETRLIKAGFETVRIKRARWWEPAGGETGVPRCLAEVRKLPEAALFRYFKTSLKA